MILTYMISLVPSENYLFDQSAARDGVWFKFDQTKIPSPWHMSRKKDKASTNCPRVHICDLTLNVE